MGNLRYDTKKEQKCQRRVGTCTFYFLGYKRQLKQVYFQSRASYELVGYEPAFGGMRNTPCKYQQLYQQIFKRFAKLINLRKG